jgi:hypothetical protein
MAGCNDAKLLLHIGRKCVPPTDDLSHGRIVGRLYHLGRDLSEVHETGRVLTSASIS